MVAKDYNYSCTKLEYKGDSKKLFISFSCFNFDDIFSIAGNYMIDKYYKGNYLLITHRLYKGSSREWI